MGKKNESESETNGLALQTDRRPRPVRSWVAVSRDWLGQRRVIAPSRRLMRCFASSIPFSHPRAIREASCSTGAPTAAARRNQFPVVRATVSPMARDSPSYASP